MYLFKLCFSPDMCPGMALQDHRVALFSVFKDLHGLPSNYHTIALISHASKVMLKILQARLQQNVNRELPDVQAGFRKGRDRKSTRLNSSHMPKSRMPSSA